MALRRPTRGLPTNANGASSFHLWWDLDRPVRRAAVTLEILRAPSVDRLYFWAFQVGFDSGAGAHTGLQWNPRHPGSTAVNWGGYTADGTLLRGGRSPLPSLPEDPNTRDLAWRPGVPYRLEVAPTPEQPGWWQATVTEPESAPVLVRNLEGGGTHLHRCVMWSEVFARCDDPSASIRWSDPIGWADDGAAVRPPRVRARYQPESVGGCSNTDSFPDATGIVQKTSVRRHTPDGTWLDLPESRQGVTSDGR